MAIGAGVAERFQIPVGFAQGFWEALPAEEGHVMAVVEEDDCRRPAGGVVGPS